MANTGFHTALVLSLLVVNTIQVEILIARGSTTQPEIAVTTSIVVAVCADHPPGVCCRAPEEWASPWVEQQPPDISTLNETFVWFRHLLPEDVATVWGLGSSESRQTNYVGCSSTIIGSGTGPGSYQYNANLVDRPAFGGASYIGIGQPRLPPDSNTVQWLVFEGLLGLVWGGGQWFEKAALSQAFSSMSTNPKLRRGIRSSNKGTVSAQQPPRWVDPAYIKVDDVTYTYGGVDDPVYRNDRGVALNLTNNKPESH